MQQAGHGAPQQHPVLVMGARRPWACCRHRGRLLASADGREGGQPAGWAAPQLHKPGAVQATRSLHSPAVFPPSENRCGQGGKGLQRQRAFQGVRVCLHGALLAPSPVIKELL